MDFNLSDEQQMLRDSVKRFVREQYGFEQRQAVARSDAGWSPAHWRTFGDLGWLALGLPEEAGGLGGKLTDMAVVLEGFGEGLVAEPYLVNMVLCARLVEHWADAAPRDALLAKMATGEHCLAFAHDEPGEAHQRRDACRTRARAVAGEGYRLDGAKTVVLGIAAAQQLLVSASFGESAGVALFLVDRNAPGVHVRPYRLIDGSVAGDVLLTDCRVPRQALLLDGESAVTALDEALDRAVLATAAESLGAMEAVLRITADHLRTRVQFGQPLAKFQALQHRMAEMFVEVQATRSALLHGLAFEEAGATARAEAVSAARLVASQAGRCVGGQGIQLHGGMGMTEECAVGHYFKRLAVLERCFGDVDWHVGRLASLVCRPS